MGIGDRIRKSRKESGLTQAQLAKMLNVSAQSIGQWERGERTPKFETLVKIAEILEDDPIYLQSPDLWLEMSGFKDKDCIWFDFDDDDLVKGLQTPERLVLDSMKLLNKLGKEVAVDRVKELTEIPKYKEEDPFSDE